MTIKIYPSIKPCDPIESHEWEGLFTDWLGSKGINYKAWDIPPTTLIVNGVEVPFSQWSSTTVNDGDVVEVRYISNGGVFKALGSIVGAVFGLAFGWLLPSNKSSGKYDTPEGKRLETVQATANTAKLGEAVPELAGRFRRYPDYLTPPRRYFTNPREQWLEFLACVGPGQYQINSSDVKVGDTPISSLGADGGYQIFEPNADLSGVATHEHWHAVEEVGGTSSGTAGLELSTELGNRENKQPASYTFNGLIITRSNGRFPSGWGNGTLVSIKYPRQYVATSTTLTGFFGHSGINVGSHFGDDWTTEIVSSQGGGYYTLAFWRMETVAGGGDQPDYEVKRYLQFAPGSRTYDFAPNVKWTISSNDEGSITLLDEGRFFENDASLSTSVSFEGGAIYGEWTSEFVVTPGNDVTSAIEFDVYFPTGLCELSDDAQVMTYSVTIEFEYRNLSNNATVSVMRTYTQRTRDQIGFTERISVPSGRYACRMRRVGSSSSSEKIQDTVHWYGLKCRLPTKTQYPNWTTISIKLRSGGRLAAQSENKINVVATRILPTLQNNGTWTSPQPTRDISAFVRYIAESIGYTLDDIDMPELLRLHNIWKSRGETVDHVFDLTTVKSALQVVLGAGMSELTIANGLIRPVRDDIRTQFESGYSPQNMTKPLVRSFKSRRHDDADGVEVEYIDANTWTNQIVICSLPGSQRLKLEKLKLNGVTDRTRAWRIGMRRARQIAYQNWEYSFETELDALNSEYLSYVPLLDDIPGYGQSALLTNVDVAGSNVILTISEEIQWQDGKDHVVAYRKADGTLAGPWPATKVNDFMIQAPIPASERPIVSLKMELPHVYIGTTEEWCFPALVTDITPRGTDSVSVTAVNYDARIYADDNNYPPN
ncbi:hypothetical protein CEQ07_05245 [Oligella urethralis]|uniref:sulfur carrier protein ThiS n=1 Tax=Oligella urethralis TaxID=90245 RepID=UPI000D00A766|nr:MoaD/ThiS family protein [Oligella urethralis]AVL70873.1 hypothetical protein CEQ07_05245 [Oligella urethralis]